MAAAALNAFLERFKKNYVRRQERKLQMFAPFRGYEVIETALVHHFSFLLSPLDSKLFHQLIHRGPTNP